MDIHELNKIFFRTGKVRGLQTIKYTLSAILKP